MIIIIAGYHSFYLSSVVELNIHFNNASSVELRHTRLTIRKKNLNHLHVQLCGAAKHENPFYTEKRNHKITQLKSYSYPACM